MMMAYPFDMVAFPFGKVVFPFGKGLLPKVLLRTAASAGLDMLEQMDLHPIVAHKVSQIV
jgi:hypothetical protein